ncbi:MAG: ribonuclease H-like domain-containing protein [Thermoplasmata archaeon]
MLRETLILFQGISYRRQKNLRREGIFTWEDLLIKGSKYFSPDRWRIIEEEILNAIENYKSRNIEYFKNRLNKRDYYLLFEDFIDFSLFLDIETTGMDLYGEITVIGISDHRKNYRAFVNGIDLDENLIADTLKNYKILVTFYGSRFDIPFISRKFPYLGDILKRMVHIDLCFLGRRVGFRGGLKSIERQVGLERDSHIQGLTGFDAVRLWNEYLSGKKESLDTLIEYNRRDVINLVDLFEIEIELMRQFYL